VVAADAPGFLVNRVLVPYLLEAALLVEEGLSVGVVDGAMKAFGMPLGPLELIDLMGVDVVHQVNLTLIRAFGESMPSSRLLALLASKGRFGRKTGAGFYLYGRRRRPDRGLRKLVKESGGKSLERSDKRGILQERMILPMINEAARCLEEGIVARPGDIDLASVLGFGFPAFRGGVLAFADFLGLADVEERLNRLADSESERFRPAPLISSLAGDKTPFGRLDEA
jgi:3-hydroxyacyl-CoA dehydrogenase